MMARIIGEGSPLNVPGNRDLIAAEFHRFRRSDESNSMLHERRAARLEIAQQHVIPLWRPEGAQILIQDSLYGEEEGRELVDSVYFGGDIFVAAKNINVNKSLLVGDYVFSRNDNSPTLRTSHFRPLITLAEGIRDGHSERMRDGLEQLDNLLTPTDRELASVRAKSVVYDVYQDMDDAAREFDGRYVPALWRINPSDVTIFDSGVYGSDDLLSYAMGATVKGSVLGVMNDGIFSDHFPFTGSHMSIEDSIIVGRDGISRVIEGRMTQGDPGAAREAVAAITEVVRMRGAAPLLAMAST